MFGRRLAVRGLAVLLGYFCSFAMGNAQEESVNLVFIEPVTDFDAGKHDQYRIIDDPKRISTIRGWMENESAQFGLNLYAEAWALSDWKKGAEQPVYYIALVPGGNHAAVGFELASNDDPYVHARTPFIKLSEKDWAFHTTFLHETGHVVLAILNGGETPPKRTIAAIPHSTAALTDRGTAFDEGFAIHLETLAAHFASDPMLVERYRHTRFLFGTAHMVGEYHRPAGDLLSYSQTIARYHEVRENNFAFAPAYSGPDYLRVQLEKPRDFANIRDANQLLQSEGFYASFFFSMIVRGPSVPETETVEARQRRQLAALAAMFNSEVVSSESPYLLLYADAYIQRYPEESGEIIDVLLDLSRGVFVDRRAPTLWRDHYLGALRLDLAERENAALESARSLWRSEVAGDFDVVYQNLGPQIRAKVTAVPVTLVAFGETRPLSFDVNTAERGVMRAIPGITDREVSMWLQRRAEKAFVSAADFVARAGLNEKTLAQLSFD